MSSTLFLIRRRHHRVVNYISKRALINERYMTRLNSIVWNIDEIEFIKNFRLNRTVFSMLMDDIRPFLKIRTSRRAVTPEVKVLIVLRFLAQGSYQRSVGNDFFLSVAQPTVSIILHEVIDIFNNVLCAKYISFPSDNELEMTAQMFKNKYRMPGIVGAIDCTHVRIVTPKENEFIYVNRKNFHSINTQLICDHKYLIWNVNAKFPGSSHDSFIWRQSEIRNYISEAWKDKNFWLFGDSGYPLEPWLIVPYKDPDQESKILFNNYHASCRSIIERCNGIIKGRWRCLKDIRGLHYTPETASKIINTCVALHNLGIKYMKEYPIIDIDDPDQLIQDIGGGIGHQRDLFTRGAEIRERLEAYVLQR